ncbi:hypothetical protein H9655_09695 [Cytobacillus sp. Sa5YUA1]|uniref:Uncharacterized protein n=1 Tax=Cytobacillus stercorigallinarum TaxID=2762240 RepID=A0ABR8QPG5_9BACI|nr:hypothetical protein [Cytobacillus stercorigallinarum]MBD7937304.1 hypothetical protein [Cytobacillus stercorigallinarum]
MIRIGNDTVIKEVEKIALNENYIHCIDRLAKIRTDASEKALLRLFEQTKNISIQTVIADALCQQLSIAAIHKVEHLLEEGFDASILELDESLYANLVLQQIDKPYINEMKNNVLQQQAHAKQLLDVYFQQPVTKKKSDGMTRSHAVVLYGIIVKRSFVKKLPLV